MRTRVALALGLSSVFVVTSAACSSDGPTTPTSTPPATSASTSASASASASTSVPASSTAASSSVASSTAPVAWTPEVARDNFLAYVDPVNTAMDDYAALGGHPRLAPLRRSCTAIAAAMADASRKLAAGQWPSNAKGPVTRLVVGLSKERAGWLRCANANSKKLSYRATRTRYRAAALGEQVRIALGLPAVK